MYIEKASVIGRITKEEVKSLLIHLVSVPSPQTELLEDEPQVKDFIRNVVAPYLERSGIQDMRFDSMGNLIARCGKAQAPGAGRSVMLIGNAMCQPPNDMPDPYEGHVINGEPYGLPGEAVLGRGASEQKATMAAMLCAVNAVARSGVKLNGTLVFVCCTSGESGKHDAIQNVVENEGVRADLAVICGSSNEISLGNRGRVDIRINVTGEASHSSAPHKGANAITGAMKVMERLAAISLPREHPDLGKQCLTCNHIRSFPDSTHTVQGSCEITLDRRLLPGEHPMEAFLAVKQAVSELDGVLDPVSRKPIRVEVKMGAYMYPSLVSADACVVKGLRAASKAVTGVEPRLIYSASAFDQGFLNHVGIETCNYGPGEESFAHTNLDMASVDRTFDAARVYTQFVLDYLGEEDRVG